MSKIADTEANATSLDGLVNDNALVPTLRNGPKPSYQYLVDGWNTEFDALIDNFESQGDGAIASINADVVTVEAAKNSAISSIDSDLSAFDVYYQSAKDTIGNDVSEFTIDSDAALADFELNASNSLSEFTIDSDAALAEFAQESAEAFNEFDLTLDQYKESRGFNTKGTFADGFTYELPNDVGLDADGNPWILIDTSSLPAIVSAGTTPTNPPYKQVAYGSASQVSTNTSDTVQSFVDSFALKIFQSPTDGGLTEIQTRTVDAGEVYEVRKTSDDSLATIYSNAAGTTEIVQDGTSNVSDSTGAVEFYIADGSYYIEVSGVRFYLNVMNYFDEIESLKENSVTLEDFGVNATSDASISFVSAVNYLIDQSNSKNTLILGPREYNFSSRAFVDCMTQDINIIGYNDMSIINSSVVGETTIDLYNTQRSTISGFYMKGNGIYGALGNGHALALRDTTPASGTYFPQNCDIKNLRLYGFRGVDTDIDGAKFESSAIFIGGGKFNNISRVLVDSCSWGVVAQKSGQTLLGESTFVGCDYFGVYMKNVGSGVIVDKSDFVNCGFGSGATISIIGGVEMHHGGTLYQNCDAVTFRDNRVKASVGGCSAFGCRLVNIEDSTLAADDIANGSSYVADLVGNKKVNINGNRFLLYNNANPLEVKTRGLRIGVNSNAGDPSCSINSNEFQHVCNSTVDIHIEGLGSSRVFCDIRDNTFGNQTITGLDVLTDDCILLEGVLLAGTISDNLFFVNERSNTCIISNSLRLDSAGIDSENIYIGRNKERAYLGGEFTNPIRTTEISGGDYLTTDSSGVFNIDTNLIASAGNVLVTPRSESPLICVVSGVSDDIVSVTVYNIDGTKFISSGATFYWSVSI